MAKRASPHPRVLRWAVVAALVGCLAFAGCGAPQVPDDDAHAIFDALQRGQLFSRQICGSIGHPLDESTRDAYTLMIRVSDRNPDAELQSPDFADAHPTIRTWLRGAAQAIASCRRRLPATGTGWRELQVRLQQATSRPVVPTLGGGA